MILSTFIQGISLLSFLHASVAPTVDLSKISAEETANLGAGYDFNDPNHPCKGFCQGDRVFLSKLEFPELLTAECFGNLGSICLWKDKAALRSLFAENGSKIKTLNEAILSFASRGQVDVLIEVLGLEQEERHKVYSKYLVNVGKNIPFGVENGCTALSPSWLNPNLISKNCLLSLKNWETILDGLPNERLRDFFTKVDDFIGLLGTMFIFNMNPEILYLFISEFMSYCSRMTIGQLQMLYLKDQNFQLSKCFLSLPTDVQEKLSGYWDEDYPEAESLIFGGLGTYDNELKRLNVNVDEKGVDYMMYNKHEFRSQTDVIVASGYDVIGDYTNIRSLSKFTPGKYKKILIEHVGLDLPTKPLSFYFNLLQGGGSFEWRSFRFMFREGVFPGRRYESGKSRWGKFLQVPASARFLVIKRKIQVDQNSLVRAQQEGLISRLDSDEYFDNLFFVTGIYFRDLIHSMVNVGFIKITFWCPMNEESREALIVEAKKPDHY